MTWSKWNPILPVKLSKHTILSIPVSVKEFPSVKTETLYEDATMTWDGLVAKIWLLVTTEATSNPTLERKINELSAHSKLISKQHIVLTLLVVM